MLEPLGIDGEQLSPLLFGLRHRPQLFDESFRRFNRRAFVLATAALALISVALYEAEVISGRASALDASWNVVMLIVLGGLLAALPVDLLCLSAAVVALSAAVRRGRWDMLLLTNVDARDIIRAEELLILAHVWKPLAVTTNIRLAASLCLAVWLVLIGGSSGVLLNFVLILLVYPYILEPRWRTRALAASGLLISAYARQSVSALLAALGIVLLVWGTQAALIGLLAFWVEVSDLGAVLFCPFAYLLLSAAMSVVYAQVERRALEAAVERMACCADDLR